MQNTSYIWHLRLTKSLFVNVDVLHCTTPLTFGACVELHHCLVFSKCCITKYLLYLALLLNYVFNCQCGCAALRKTSYISRLC